MLKEFKVFAMKGNVVDLAVAVIIGAAFGRIITSLVNDIIMPPIGLLLGGVDFSELKIQLAEAVMVNGEVIKEAVTINYGLFTNTVINFLIVAFSIFMMVKALNSAKKKEVPAPAAPPAPTNEEKLLIEIRDALKNK